MSHRIGHKSPLNGGPIVPPPCHLGDCSTFDIETFFNVDLAAMSAKSKLSLSPRIEVFILRSNTASPLLLVRRTFSSRLVTPAKRPTSPLAARTTPLPFL